MATVAGHRGHFDGSGHSLAGGAGHLLSPQPYVPAAVAFYVLYLMSVWLMAVLPSRTFSQGFRRGAAMGFFGYGVYELTNWAMLRDWPAALVPIDWIWGIFLTGTSAALGSLVQSRLKS